MVKVRGLKATKVILDEAKIEDAPRSVKIKLLSDYRDVAKKGDVWETDKEKADELVKLGRAEYLK